MDQGQRYEIRFVTVKGERVLGFGDDLAGCMRVVDHLIGTGFWGNEPITEAFVIDRRDRKETLICLTCRGQIGHCTVCGGTGQMMKGN